MRLLVLGQMRLRGLERRQAVRMGVGLRRAATVRWAVGLMRKGWIQRVLMRAAVREEKGMRAVGLRRGPAQVVVIRCSGMAVQRVTVKGMGVRWMRSRVSLEWGQWWPLLLLQRQGAQAAANGGAHTLSHKMMVRSAEGEPT